MLNRFIAALSGQAPADSTRKRAMRRSPRLTGARPLPGLEDKKRRRSRSKPPAPAPRSASPPPPPPPPPRSPPRPPASPVAVVPAIPAAIPAGSGVSRKCQQCSSTDGVKIFSVLGKGTFLCEKHQGAFKLISRTMAKARGLPVSVLVDAYRHGGIHMFSTRNYYNPRTPVRLYFLKEVDELRSAYQYTEAEQKAIQAARGRLDMLKSVDRARDARLQRFQSTWIRNPPIVLRKQRVGGVWFGRYPKAPNARERLREPPTPV